MRITAIAMLGVSFAALTSAAQAQQLRVAADDIGGVVTSAKGPEAGVWVIAQTKDLPTGYVKIVVTDDQGRYLIPDLPKGTYDVWVRGYGLVDSPKVKAQPGKNLDL
ncbi:MAG TPA: carboxypeptidase-like regulatory domain-containing protein, partial [Micropepsaceae bacterium]|nr:carboxypeptidase-like regulatory domain-containing protein [Micropepsaceae bacterium]